MSWLRPAPDERRLLAQERLILEATEAVCEALAHRGTTRRQLAGLLKVRPSEITQRLRGRRNLTLRTLADMLDALGFDAHIAISERPAAREPARLARVTTIESPSPQAVYGPVGAGIAASSGIDYDAPRTVGLCAAGAAPSA